MKTPKNTLKFYLSNRYILFCLLLASFSVVSRIFSGEWLPSTETKDLWFYSGLFMVLFSVFFIEPYYTSPKNVIANVIPLVLVLLSIKASFANQNTWLVSLVVLLVLLIASIAAMGLNDANYSDQHWRNRYAIFLRTTLGIIGTGKVLYSGVFLYFIISYYSEAGPYLLILLLFWANIILLDPKKLHNSLTAKSGNSHKDQIGEIFGVQSKKIFLVKLFEDRKSIKRFDIVKFRYSMQDIDSLVIIGIVFDTYLLNQEKWAKVLQLREPEKGDSFGEKNVVYLMSDPQAVERLDVELRINDFVGVISEGSTIGKIRFEYSKRTDNLQDGDLVELVVGNRRLFYQVVGGITEKQRLEERNETGFIVGEAVQLGEWLPDEFAFKKFGWVPSINTPIYKTNANLENQTFAYPSFRLGVIPGTSFPSVVDLDKAISHHMALIGVTGSGKSFLAREIIQEIKKDTKIICVDFNKEFVATLNPPPLSIIEEENAAGISDRIEWINAELEKFGNQQDKKEIEKQQKELRDTLSADIKKFLNRDDQEIAIFELPDVSNTTGIFDYTRHFFRMLFEIAKKEQTEGNPRKICVVLEEAHTIVPEWNFSGSGDKNSQALVNSIGQIALQGRKYGVGFLVIAQRTANVSKTVLTQCNTIVCFQAFDETSFNFLGNYIGKDLVRVLPNLKDHHAVVAGKGVKSNMPLIIDLSRELQPPIQPQG